MEGSMSDKEILVVVSKLKTYIKSSADMNTAGNVAPRLSDIVRGLCDEAVQRAKADGRKTVMDRDF
jgi:histone H3/H4